MAKYQGTKRSEPIQENGKVSDDGCSGYSFFNAGNVNVTIDETTVLLPRQTFTGPDMHPDVTYHDTHTVIFDEVNLPTLIAPSGGTNPQSTVAGPGAIAKDKRVLFTKVFLNTK